mmetsp:Transcript_86598/g.245154  ORF Transcript_86598/g.245154 Transcript_86598/m.245154 type:complete len:218 (+) Transcript_86598:2972-3625(+)
MTSTSTAPLYRNPPSACRAVQALRAPGRCQTAWCQDPAAGGRFAAWPRPRARRRSLPGSRTRSPLPAARGPGERPARTACTAPPRQGPSVWAWPPAPPRTCSWAARCPGSARSAPPARSRMSSAPPSESSLAGRTCLSAPVGRQTLPRSSTTSENVRAAWRRGRWAAGPPPTPPRTAPAGYRIPLPPAGPGTCPPPKSSAARPPPRSRGATGPCRRA